MEIITNAPVVGKKFDELVQAINFQRENLFQQLGIELTDDVKRRIASQDNGNWETLSKWSLSRRPAEQPLQGIDKFVKYRASQDGLTIYGDTGSDWTLSQHDQGFTNDTSHDKRTSEGKIEISIVNPGPLGLGSNATTFAWSPTGNVGKTPARKIWATSDEASKITYTVASRWLEAIVKQAMGDV